jgi:cytidylate kinase
MAIIAISQQLGSRGTELGRLAASELGYSFATSDELIKEAAERFRVSAEDLLLFDLRTPHFWERRRSESHRYIAFFRAVLLNKLAGGRIVVAGHSLAHHAPQSPAALRLRVVAPLAARVARLAEDEKSEPHAAERQVRDHDRELKARAQTLYGIDVDDPTLYDLTVNSSAHPLPAQVAAIAGFVRRIDETATQQHLDAIGDHAVAAQVRAALLAHPKVRDAQVGVSCNSGIVHVSGPGLVPPWDALVDEIARKVDGVRRVEVAAEEPPPPLRSE